MDDGPAKYLFVVSSSYGHLFPAIRAAHILQKRGGDVLFVTARENQMLFDTQGVKCVTFSRQPHPFLSTHNWFDPAANCELYAPIKAVSDNYRPHAIVATPLALPAFVLSEVCSIPLIVLSYSEYLFPSIGEAVSSKQWRIESITSHYNGLRALLGLSPVPADSVNSPLIGSKHLIRSVPEFTTQGDLPKQVAFVGPLLWEPSYVNHELDRFVAAGRDMGEPMFFVQIGRLFEDWTLWEKMVRVLGNISARFLVDLGRSDYLQHDVDFPENFYLHPFIPLSYVSEEVVGVICSGQTTVIMSALTHGKPILTVPNSADGREIAYRVVQHGLGESILDLHGLDRSTVESFLDSVTRNAFENNLLQFQSVLRTYDDDEQLFEKISI